MNRPHIAPDPGKGLAARGDPTIRLGGQSPQELAKVVDKGFSGWEASGEPTGAVSTVVLRTAARSRIIAVALVAMNAFVRYLR